MWVKGYVPVEPAFDAEFCPDELPPNARACLVYSGGTSVAHVWDAAELARVKHLPRLPTWVPTPGSDDPQDAAHLFLAWLAANGVPARDHLTDQRTRLLWDLETGKEPDPEWYTAAADVTKAAGFANLAYGSISTLFGVPQRSGYIVANPTGVPHLYQRAGVVGTQWRWNVPSGTGRIDNDLLTTELVGQLWQPGA